MTYWKHALLLVAMSGLFANNLLAMRLPGLSGNYKQIATGQYYQERNLPFSRYGRVIHRAPVVRPITIDMRKKSRPSNYSAPTSPRKAALINAAAKRRKNLKRTSAKNRNSVTGLAAKQRAALANLLSGPSIATGFRRESTRQVRQARAIIPSSVARRSNLKKASKSKRKSLKKVVTAPDRRRSLKEAVQKRKQSLRVAKSQRRGLRTLGPPPPFRLSYTKTARDWVARYQPGRR